MDRPVLPHAVRRGGWAIAGCQIASQLVSIAVLAVLYRLLAPQDFGLFALSSVVVNLARIFANWGLSVSSVQDPSLTDEEQSLLAARGWRWALMILLAVLAIAKPYEWILGMPRLGEVTIISCLSVVILSFGIQHQARLERRMLVDRVAYLRLAAQVAGGVAAIVLAVQQSGVWALVGQLLVETCFLVLALRRIERWQPGNVPEHSAEISRFKRFGGFYTASSLLFWVAQNVDTLVVGALAGTYAVGLYSQAFNLTMRPVLLVTTAVTSLMLPALSRAVTNPPEYRRLLLSFYRIVGLLLLPCSVGMFVLAPALMLLLGGPKWRDAGVLLQAFSPIIAVQGFINIAGSVFASVGRPDRLFAGSIAIAALTCQGIVAGWWLGTQFGPPEIGGVLGLAIAYSAVTVLVIAVPYLWFCLSTVPIPMRDVLLVLAKPAAASILMGASVWTVAAALNGQSPNVQFLAAFVVGILVYGLIMNQEIVEIICGKQTAIATPGM